MEREHLTVEEQQDSSMWDLLEEEFDYRELQRGDIRTGVVISKSENRIVVDIGAKREGVVPETDLEKLGAEAVSMIQVGDEVPVYVLSTETADGDVLVSLNMAQTIKDWQRARELYESGEIYEAKVVGYNRGGVLVEFGQLQGFVPRSHLVAGSPRGASGSGGERLVGETIPLKVIEVSRRRKRLILSERAAWREWRRLQKTQLLDHLKEGDIRKGRVSSIADFGAFVDLGGRMA